MGPLNSGSTATMKDGIGSSWLLWEVVRSGSPWLPAFLSRGTAQKGPLASACAWQCQWRRAEEARSLGAPGHCLSYHSHPPACCLTSHPQREWLCTGFCVPDDSGGSQSGGLLMVPRGHWCLHLQAVPPSPGVSPQQEHLCFLLQGHCIHSSQVLIKPLLSHISSCPICQSKSHAQAQIITGGSNPGHEGWGQGHQCNQRPQLQAPQRVLSGGGILYVGIL